MPYDIVKVKRSLVADNPKNDLTIIRTRKPLLWLTAQEQLRLERAP